MARLRAQTFFDRNGRLLSELVAEGKITNEDALAHPEIAIVGMVGSIDNDMFGTDMTIGADTALHRIVEAVDAIISTAVSHQRSFIVEVMGRHCGYLALMAGLATGANWVLIPENPPEVGWEDTMCEKISAGRASGAASQHHHHCRRRDQPGGQRDLQRLCIERITPSPERRSARRPSSGMSSEAARPARSTASCRPSSATPAVHRLLNGTPDREPQLDRYCATIAYQASPLMENVLKTRHVEDLIHEHKYEQAMEMRGRGFVEAYAILNTLLRAQPRPPQEGQKPLRLAIMHGDGPAPGMNTAVRAAVRLGLDQATRCWQFTTGWTDWRTARFAK